MRFYRTPLSTALSRRVLWRLGRKIYMLSRFDGPNDPLHNGEYAIVDRLLDCKVGGHFVDVGAHYGLWTKNVLETAKRRGVKIEKIIAIEPNPELARVLREKFANDENDVEVLQVALGNENGTRTFFLEPTSGGTSSLWNKPSENSRECLITVMCFDSLVERDAYFAMVKIDAEGGDFLVLQGMKNALARRSVGLVQFEYNIRWRATRTFLFDVWNFAADVGYEFGKIVPGGGIVLTAWNDELERFFEANYFLADPFIVERLGLPRVRWTKYNTL